MGKSAKDRDRVPDHIASFQDVKTREELIALARKFIDEGINSGPSIDGDEVFRELRAELNARQKAKEANAG